MKNAVSCSIHNPGILTLWPHWDRKSLGYYKLDFSHSVVHRGGETGCVEIL
jgi:hypothetical protein